MSKEVFEGVCWGVERLFTPATLVVVLGGGTTMVGVVDSVPPLMPLPLWVVVVLLLL